MVFFFYFSKCGLDCIGEWYVVIGYGVNVIKIIVGVRNIISVCDIGFDIDKWCVVD